MVYQRIYITSRQSLKQRTEDWLLSEQEVTITLDIGTCLGFTLLAVLLIKGPEVRLMKITPTCSKKGTHLANLCIESLQSETVSLDILKSKIVGVVGDGAFMKGNIGFKTTMKELLNDKLQFRWDILHLANRAHVDTRGTTAAYLKEAAKVSHLEEDGEVESPAASLSATPISELIDMIQKSIRLKELGSSLQALKSHLNHLSYQNCGVQLECVGMSMSKEVFRKQRVF